MKNEVSNDELFMKQALIQAQKALEKGEIPIGAVIVHNNTIIARAHNMTETLNDPTAHAEMLVITSATEKFGNKYLKNCTLYVTVEPCCMCAGAAHWAQISKIVFGASDEKKGWRVFNANIINSKVEIIEGVVASECKALMTYFFSKKRKNS